MEPTPNTLNYMLSGYTIFAVVFFGYIISLISRWKNLRAEEKMLDEMEKNSSSNSTASPL
ncbi:MAG: hypothetical protein CO094_10465 [Anaerolineae bacterium CG_4_9_14_3_um_filter_57_17]|nr:hypothetical protein [bacterium]NCT20856.1 hypothetical protein [bacterium]OIO84431.1 MAG: hypothetical protein AUK01_09435 [Anaerolineae bacterium CG2_30_57_67]PJB65227.1 MAG: hypothetical protein CO094_10465 [Anaerolineae bacterium CG_4_9_14_3_um_filter_57_17]